MFSSQTSARGYVFEPNKRERLCFRAKQAREVMFSRTTNKIVHPPLCFNKATVKLSHIHKHLGLQLDSKLSFNEHINFKGARKLCFMHYSRMVIILFSTGLCKSAFSICSFSKTRFSSFQVSVCVCLVFSFQFFYSLILFTLYKRSVKKI